MQFDSVEHCDEGGRGQEVAGEIVRASCDAPPTLDAAEKVLDFVPPPVKGLGTIGVLQGGAAVRNDGQCAFVFDLLTYLCAIVGLVGGDSERRSRRGPYLFDDLTIVDLSSSYREAERPIFAVDNRMDFCGSTAAADADRLIFLPSFALLTARWDFTTVLSIRYRPSRDFDANWPKIRFQMPREDQQLATR